MRGNWVGRFRVVAAPPSFAATRGRYAFPGGGFPSRSFRSLLACGNPAVDVQHLPRHEVRGARAEEERGAHDVAWLCGAAKRHAGEESLPAYRVGAPLLGGFG